MLRNRFVIFLIISVFFSCKKSGNNGSPTVQITSPTGNPTYSVFDTIQVKAHVSDAVSLQSVTVYIVNSQNVPVLANATVPISGKDFSFTCPYVLGDIHLTSGAYTIVVRAYNGTNATLGYQKITINAAPTIRTGIYAVTRNSGGVHVLKIDTSFNVSTLYTQTGDYSSSDISSYYQQLYIGAADSGNVNTLAMPGGSPSWGVVGIVSSSPCFTNIYSNGNSVYVSEYLGFIKYYNSSGALATVFNVTAGNYPIKTCSWSNYLFAEIKNIGSTTRNLVLYYSGSGTGFEQSVLPGPVVTMYGMDNNDLYVFGNKDSGGAYLQLFNISGNIFYSPITLPSAKLLSVTQIDAQTYLIGFDNGIIYKYTYNPNSIVPFINGVVASHLQFDIANNEVIASSGKYVSEYSYSSAALIHAANAQDSVLNLHVLYNK
ncbi:MAG TPA: Ig-like domain-containing protein [Bacteroidia bacterium]|nr:Ig-like domain-containing protein [Bacteroidia bacterium]